MSNATDLVKNTMSRHAAEMRARYSVPRNFYELALDAEKQWKIATEFSRTSLSNITEAKRKQAQYNALDLLELKGYATSQPGTDTVPQDIVQMALPRLVAPFYWLTDISVPVLERQENLDKIRAAIKDAPGDALAWSLRQLLAGLGLPSWVLPVVGVTAITGLAWWAYSSFLAPVRTVSRTARRLT